MPDRNVILFQDRSEGKWETFDDPEMVLRRIALYEWGEPEHFDAVCASLEVVAEGTNLEDVVQDWGNLRGVESR